MPDSPLATLGLVALAAMLLIVSGVTNKARIGIVLVAALIWITARLGLTSFAQMGFGQPASWPITVLLGLLIGGSLALLSTMLIEPLIEHITQQLHDTSVVEDVRGNWKSLLWWLVMVWSVVAFGEEVMFRGFLMSELNKVLGTSGFALGLNVLLTAVIFGLAHSYQGRSGAWSSGMIGACLGVIYVLSGFNLWLPIVVHGVIDTVELALMSRGADKRLKELIWKEPLQDAA